MSDQGFVSPFDSPEVWDVILLADEESPGIADVAGAGSPRMWDKRKGQGLSGSTLVFTGDDLSEFTVVLRFTTPDHIDAWNDWKRLVAKTQRGVRAKAIDIYHPALADVGIKSVVVLDVSQMEKEGDTGEQKVTIKFESQQKPLPAVGKADNSYTKPGEPTAKDANEQAMQDLQKQAADLKKELAK
jgi:hypothetical protein